MSSISKHARISTWSIFQPWDNLMGTFGSRMRFRWCRTGDLTSRSRGYMMTTRSSKTASRSLSHKTFVTTWLHTELSTSRLILSLLSLTDSACAWSICKPRLCTTSSFMKIRLSVTVAFIPMASAQARNNLKRADLIRVTSWMPTCSYSNCIDRDPQTTTNGSSSTIVSIARKGPFLILSLCYYTQLQETLFYHFPNSYM